MHFLLDTNVVIALLNDVDSRAAKLARRHKPSDIGISAIVIHELYFGAFHSKRAQANVALVDELQFEVVDFDKEDARQSGEIRAALAAEGMPIGPYDILIAGQAKSRDLVLVTRNSREFGRIPGLKVEDWET
jgi:tRNA(fMet)-specific endonuclease VapC